MPHKDRPFYLKRRQLIMKKLRLFLNSVRICGPVAVAMAGSVDGDHAMRVREGSMAPDSKSAAYPGLPCISTTAGPVPLST